MKRIYLNIPVMTVLDYIANFKVTGVSKIVAIPENESNQMIKMK